MDYENYRWIPVVNSSGEEIPAFAVMEVIDTDSEENVTVSKPSEDSDKLILINGPSIIQIDGTGMGTIDMPFWAYYDTNDGTPASGERWGARSGSWKISKNKNGFLVIGMRSNSPPPSPEIVFVKWEECRQ